MTTHKDPRRRVGAVVHAKATIVTNIAQCARLYGSQAKTKFINGTVVEVIVDRSTGRASTFLKVEWVMTTTPTILRSIKVVIFNNIKNGRAPVPLNSTTRTLEAEQE